jgi:hypothetical protein
VALGIALTLGGTGDGVPVAGGVGVAGGVAVVVLVGAGEGLAGIGEEVAVLATVIRVSGGRVALGAAMTHAARTRPLKAGESLAPSVAIARKNDTSRPPASTQMGA